MGIDCFLVACTALRAYRNGLTAPVKQCDDSWEPVARCSDPHFVECVNFRALSNIIESLTRDNIRAYEEELPGLDVKKAEKDIVLSKCISSQQSWAVKKPKLTIHAISSADAFQSSSQMKRHSSFADGLPYVANRSVGGIGAKFLFAAYQACLQGVALPASCGASQTYYS